MKNSLIIILSGIIVAFFQSAYSEDSVIPAVLFNGDAVTEKARQAAQPFAESKQQSLTRLREHYASNQFRSFKRQTEKTLVESIELLGEDGTFSDLRAEESVIRKNRMDESRFSKQQSRVSQLNSEAFDRLWLISETFRQKKVDTAESIALRDRVFKGFIHYGTLEAGRANVSGGRFHVSCFAIPLANINSYFCFFEDMKRVESGAETDPLFVHANEALKTMGYQSWTQPYRHDETDENVVSVERFQKHVWWVGGNAITYRPVLQASIMMNSIPMMDVMAEVAKGAISPISQTTIDEGFWTEGFTADGAGWGHGMQALIWGYPVHGAGTALSILDTLSDSAWGQTLEASNVGTLMNFVRGSSWFYYKGFVPPVLGIGNMVYQNLEPKVIPSLSLVEKQLLKNFSGILTSSERAELVSFAAEAAGNQIRMVGHPDGHYSGSRYFYNNDDLVVKNDDFYFFINMASIRCDGLESDIRTAAKYNFYTSDGLTLFLRRGDEAKRALGGFNLTAFPGVTARQGEDLLVPLTNWRGYCSKHNFAAAATRGGENASAGFIFEKMNASTKEGVNDLSGIDDENEVIYGVKAYKSWFVFGETLLALGAGIRNLEPQQEGEIWTTIEQTIWDSPITSNQQDFAHDGVTRRYELDLQGAIPWVKQDNGFTYAVLPEQTMGKVELVAERRPSKWDRIAEPNVRIKDKPETIDILQLVINHGRRVNGDTYGYIVYAGDRDPAQVFAQSPVKVISNTTDLQAASSLDEQIVGAVFYNPEAELEVGAFTIEVSAPCALLIEFNVDGVAYLTVTDAEMNVDLDEITVRVNNRKIVIPLPQEPHRGKPATMAVARE